MIRNKKKNTIADCKTCFTHTQCIILVGCFILGHNVSHSSDCRVPATICDVQSAVSEAASQFAPVPPPLPLAPVSISVTSVTSIVPSAGIVGPVTYNYTVTNTLRAVATNFTTPFNISCIPTPIFRIYNGGVASSGSSATDATFSLSNIGTSCPFGTLSCGSPSAITLAMATSGTVVTATDTNYSSKTFLSTNTGWNAYVTGYYTCTYTDPNFSTAATIIVSWPQGS